MSVSSVLSKLFLLVPKATLIRTVAKAFATYVLPVLNSRPDVKAALKEFIKALVEADPALVTEAVAAAAPESK